MSDKLTRHDIASLYKRGATEQPSSQLDEQILKRAADDVTANKVTPINKPKRFYQTWYGQLSTAASLVLVAVLYVQNTEQYHQPSELINKPQILNDQQSQVAPETVFEVMETQASEHEHAEVKLKHTLKRSASQMAAPQLKLQSMDTDSEFLKLAAITKSVANDFKVIDQLMIEGKTKVAKAQLKMLLTEHPELKAHLTDEYKKLQQDSGD